MIMNKEFDDNGQKCAVCVCLFVWFICMAPLLKKERKEREYQFRGVGGSMIERKVGEREIERYIYIVSFSRLPHSCTLNFSLLYLLSIPHVGF